MIDITRVDVVRVLDEAKERFIRADAALKTFRFSYPAKSEEFEEWKHLRDAWEQCDQELQAAREDLRDFDQGEKWFVLPAGRRFRLFTAAMSLAVTLTPDASERWGRTI